MADSQHPAKVEDAITLPDFDTLSLDDFNPATALKLPIATLFAYARSEIRSPGGRPYALVKSTSHPTLPLRIWNYNDRVANSKNPLIRASRALVTDNLGNVVSRSFTKFYNSFESGAYKPTGDEYAAVVEEKVDGSIMSVFWYEGEWRIISKGAFSSGHVDKTQELLDEVYPEATRLFDKDKTYVFELVHPNLPQAVTYAEKKLFLLSVIGKDGSEPPLDYDWSMFPFPRPRTQEVAQNKAIDYNQLKDLNLINEEGFVVKYFRTKEDRHPQRVKVKFKTYLERLQKRSNVTPRGLVFAYVRARMTIPSLKWGSVVSPRLEKLRENEKKTWVKYSDDLGGLLWLTKVERMDTQVRAFFVEKERQFCHAINDLLASGIKPGSNIKAEQAAFAKRVLGLEKWYRDALVIWYRGADDGEIVSLMVKSIPIPDDLLLDEPLH
ncbi:hypothetical protein ONZ45_g9907 [Pleurotus djamor]|nr:hypothetical protein ONZ45_g9907 [Pleurotus djamor]